MIIRMILSHEDGDIATIRPSRKCRPLNIAADDDIDQRIDRIKCPFRQQPLAMPNILRRAAFSWATTIRHFSTNARTSQQHFYYAILRHLNDIRKIMILMRAFPPPRTPTSAFGLRRALIQDTVELYAQVRRLSHRRSLMGFRWLLDA